MLSRTKFVGSCAIGALVLGLMVTSGCTRLGQRHFVGSRAASDMHGDCSHCGVPCYGYHPTQWSAWPEWCVSPPMNGPVSTPEESLLSEPDDSDAPPVPEPAAPSHDAFQAPPNEIESGDQLPPSAAPPDGSLQTPPEPAGNGDRLSPSAAPPDGTSQTPPEPAGSGDRLSPSAAPPDGAERVPLEPPLQPALEPTLPAEITAYYLRVREDVAGE